MALIAFIGGVLLILLVLLDAFETVVLPRRVAHLVRMSTLFYRTSWMPWAALARRWRGRARTENFLALYGPLSLILLLVLWATALIVGFAVLQWSLGTRLEDPEARPDFLSSLYFSGTTFFTLGLGDVAPEAPWARALAVIESGTGFAFLALVIGYLPALNGAFSHREVHVSLLDGRAGSPPSALELLRRHCQGEELAGIDLILHDWERWSAELLESHLSYPVLAYFRSQHDNQSWLAALTTILDTSVLVIVGIGETSARQAQLTFEMARHAAVDLSQVLDAPPQPVGRDRLPPAELALLRSTLKAVGLRLREGEDADRQLAELRSLYEPYVNALSRHLLMPLPAWIPPADVPDDWQTSAWERPGPGDPKAQA